MYNHDEFVSKLKKNGAYRIEELAPNVVVAFTEEADPFTDDTYLKEAIEDQGEEYRAENERRLERYYRELWYYEVIFATLYVAGTEIEQLGCNSVESDCTRDEFRMVEDALLDKLKDYKPLILNHIDMLFKAYTDALEQLTPYTNTVKVLTEVK